MTADEGSSVRVEDDSLSGMPMGELERGLKELVSLKCGRPDTPQGPFRTMERKLEETRNELELLRAQQNQLQELVGQMLHKQQSMQQSMQQQHLPRAPPDELQNPSELAQLLREESGTIIDTLDAVKQEKLEVIAMMHTFHHTKEAAMQELADLRESVLTELEGRVPTREEAVPQPQGQTSAQEPAQQARAQQGQPQQPPAMQQLPRELSGPQQVVQQHAHVAPRLSGPQLPHKAVSSVALPMRQVSLPHTMLHLAPKAPTSPARRSPSPSQRPPVVYSGLQHCPSVDMIDFTSAVDAPSRRPQSPLRTARPGFPGSLGQLGSSITARMEPSSPKRQISSIKITTGAVQRPMSPVRIPAGSGSAQGTVAVGAFPQPLQVAHASHTEATQVHQQMQPSPMQNTRTRSPLKTQQCSTGDVLAQSVVRPAVERNAHTKDIHKSQPAVQTMYLRRDASMPVIR